MKRFLLLLAMLVVSCAPVASAPSASPSPTTSAVATATASPTSVPTATPTQSPAATPISLPTTAQVAAAGNGVVWMLVGAERLFLSTDRADTWQERGLPRAPFANSEIAFISDREGWLMTTSSPATQCQEQTVTLYHTTDGAQTWQKLAPTGIADRDCKGAITFVDATHGYFTTSSPNSAPSVYRTADGGQTWRASSPLADPPGFTSGPAGFELRAGPVADFGATSFLSAAGVMNGVQKQFVYRSTDRGATWTYASPTLQSPTVVFLTPLRWLQIVPRDSRITNDAGATWPFFASDYQQAAPVDPQIAFGDANVGYATVRGSIQRTLDGGAHWGAIKTPGT